jgi:hypothetical protein
MYLMITSTISTKISFSQHVLCTKSPIAENVQNAMRDMDPYILYTHEIFILLQRGVIEKLVVSSSPPCLPSASHHPIIACMQSVILVFPCFLIETSTPVFFLILFALMLSAIIVFTLTSLFPLSILTFSPR